MELIINEYKWSRNSKHLHNHISQMVDAFDGDAAGFGFVERQEVSLLRVAQSSLLISALKVVLSN